MRGNEPWIPSVSNEFRGSFREHVDKVISGHEPLKVTGHKGAAFMVIDAEDWEREQETLYVLGNRLLMEQVTRSAETHTAAEGYRPTPEQLRCD